MQSAVSSAIRILVVDEQPVYRLGLESMISEQPRMQLVGQASDGAKCMELAESTHPDVAVIDLALPDMDGTHVIELLRKKKADRNIRFLVLTSRTGAHDINRALQAGAHAYLFKDAPLEDCITAIRTIAEGGRYIPPAVGRKAELSPAAKTLTSREREVILWLARGFSYEMIGEELGVGTETVKSHMKNILGKLGMKSRSEAVATCLRSGLVKVDSL
jgi:DNA-binding NarL/FixJ family response regulator